MRHILILFLLFGAIHFDDPVVYGRVADDLWYNGSVEDAFKKAKKQEKPIFLYWGAVWCPPCNEIKSQVFSKPRFKAVMKPFVSVYLDGDTDRAQVWGEKLNVRGYPTILIYNPKGEEVMRIDSGLNMAEFEEAIASALKSRRSFREAVKLVRNGKASDDDWQILASMSWGQLHNQTFEEGEKLRILGELIPIVPTPLDRVNARLRAKWLSEALRAAKDQKFNKDLDASVGEHLNYLLDQQSRVMTVRNLLIYSGASIISKLSSATASTWEPRIAKAVDSIAKLGDLSVDQKLWARVFKWQIQKKVFPDLAPSPRLKSMILDAVKDADAEAKSKFERHAVISNAAYLLRQAGLFRDAEKLLLKEIKTTDTPWYYYSGLSRIATAQGRHQEAGAYMTKAKDSAKGRATKLQWVVSDLLFIADQEGVSSPKNLEPVVHEYYKIAVALPDGFLGRNGLRARRVAKGLSSKLDQPGLKKILLSYRGKCGRLKGVNGTRCQEHFKTMGL